MIRLVFDNAKAIGTPEVYRVHETQSERLEFVQSVTLLPGAFCRVVQIEQPIRIEGDAVATRAVEDRYEAVVL